ncbi:chemotaxis protein CheW [Myxococcota bacterium]
MVRRQLLETHRSLVGKSLVGFEVDGVAYAVPIAAVREIANPLPLTSLPHAPWAVVGVGDHRGEVVPVVDLRLRFGLGRFPDQRRTKWIFVQLEDRTLGLIVDKVTDVFGTGGALLKPPPVLGEGDDKRGIAGVVTHQGVLTFVLDVQRFRDLVEPLRGPALLPAGEQKQ